MPEEPTPPIKPSDAEAEWTDDVYYQDLEPLPPTNETVTDEVADDEWEAATRDWEEEIDEPPPVPTAPTTGEALAWLRPWLRQLRASWQRLIAGLRNRVPAAANLSDGALTAILISILVVLLVLLSSVRQPSVAIEEPIDKPPVSEPIAPSIIEPDQPISASSPEATPAPAVPKAPPEPIAAAEKQADMERIAQIQMRLTDSSIYNANRVIDSVQADFANNRLKLVCNDDWFRLSNYDQALLANQLRSQSVDLSFSDLQLQTADGDLIARSPVIGDEMVILLREKPPEVPIPERPRYRITVDR